MNEFIPPAKPLIGDEEREAVDRVMRSGMIAQGPEVAAFEEEFAAGSGRAHRLQTLGSRAEAKLELAHHQTIHYQAA